MTNKLTFEQYCAAYREAQHQKALHTEQTSGAWSIDGKKFCEQYHLDYEKARDYEDDMDREEFYDWMLGFEIRIQRQIGRLTEEQRLNLQDYCESEWCPHEEEFEFWFDIARQLTTAYPEFDKRYYKEKEFQR